MLPSYSMSPHSKVLRGHFAPPGDKSIGHRLALLGAIAHGRTRIEGFPPGRDCGRTVDLVRSLGVEAKQQDAALEIEGVGLHGLQAPEQDLDAGNSGSTARMACGYLAPQRFECRIVGDESLSQRPIDRVVKPLAAMGASIETSGGRLPLTIHGGRELHGIDYELPIPSAQVKTAILLAGLHASGTTRVRETLPSRNHTEIALRGFGAEPVIDHGVVSLHRVARLSAGHFRVPGDFSSAAFFLTAAAFLPDSDLVVENVGLNPTRAALLDVLLDMGADIHVEPHETDDGEEPIGNIRVRGQKLHGAVVPADKLPAMIDEVPILAVAAAFADGTTRVEGASELRVKESDRLTAIIEGLDALGADVAEIPDGFVVKGGRQLSPASLATYGDHRMVMAWAIASLGVDGDCTIDHLDQVKISYPGFWETLEYLAR